MYQELQKGWIEVIAGPMFAGKSEELIRRLVTLSYARKRIAAFKPVIDDRYDRSKIASHAGKLYEAYAIGRAEQILEHIDDSTQVVGIDEAQFFDSSLVGICERLADRGIRVIIAGLDLDFTGRPFGPMGELLCRAEFVTKLEAACTICGCGATRTQRLVNGEPADPDGPIIAVGATESYEARCRIHHVIPEIKP